jgi:hypothetical protein
MFAEPERIIIGSGAEQLYETVVKILGREKIYGIESPSYDKIKAVYIGAEAKICEMELGEDGISSESLERERIDVLHVTPFHSYPSGITASLSKRYEYLKWAERAHGYIVEDDFYSEFFTSGRPPSTLYSLDARDSVIYINTFSKSLSPSIRIGYMILPEKYMKVYREKMGDFSCTVPVLDQYVLAEFMDKGHFEQLFRGNLGISALHTAHTHGDITGEEFGGVFQRMGDSVADLRVALELLILVGAAQLKQGGIEHTSVVPHLRRHLGTDIIQLGPLPARIQNGEIVLFFIGGDFGGNLHTLQEQLDQLIVDLIDFHTVIFQIHKETSGFFSVYS